jgi:hypothetical protein
MKRTIFIVIAVIIIAGAVWYAYSTGLLGAKHEKMTVSTFDLTAALSDASSSPVGLPTDLPVEKQNITEQNRLEYPDRGVTLYSISYISAEEPSVVSATYNNYLQSHGYTLSTSTSTAELISYQAVLGADSLSVIVTPAASGTLVQLGVVHTHAAQ